MFPDPLIGLPGVEINAFVLMLFVAAAVALPVALATARVGGYPAAFALDAWFAGTIAFVGGASLLPALLRPLVGDLGSTWSLAGIGAALAVETFLVRRHRAARGDPALALGVAVLPLPLAQVFGRRGCFAAGCGHGRPAWDLPWAVTFPAYSASAFQGVPVHPTQLYEVAGLAAIFAVLALLWRREGTRRSLLGAYLVGYGTLRFTVEFFRGDLRPMLGPLSLNQVICVAAVAVGAVLLVRAATVHRAIAEAA